MRGATRCRGDARRKVPHRQQRRAIVTLHGRRQEQRNTKRADRRDGGHSRKPERVDVNLSAGDVVAEVIATETFSAAITALGR